MYQDDDPYLAGLREVLLAFPESVEVEARGRPTFRAGKKIFGVFSGTEERPWGRIFKPDSDERAPLLEDERFYSPPYFGPSGWLALDSRPLPSTGTRCARSSRMRRTAWVVRSACSKPWTAEPFAEIFDAAVVRGTFRLIIPPIEG